MPFDSQPDGDDPKRAVKRSRIFVWPNIAYFLIAILVGAIVANLLSRWAG